ncbi:FAS1-like dehydratase domain-containing protein [Caballeronia sp. DA-9]|uniref:FAS1-like dehydratase domain-containing protein n=1 Tax=Caballeronia sp. DA-9 TaxID=3436237 RepID=UPI003F66AFDA
MDEDSLSGWIGTSEVLTDSLDSVRFNAAAATLLTDASNPLDASNLPPLWHWMYFWSPAAHDALGDDGHPKKGGFLPPVKLPRRMWAGGKLVFRGTPVIGDTLTRTSTVTAIREATGRSGPLVFVTVRHQYTRDDVLLIEEYQDIVYRGRQGMASAASQPKEAPSDHAWSSSFTPDTTLLFRYSALTFNGHRIHYDRDYAICEEGYAGLVVQGPLVATLLAGFAQRHLQMPLSSFAFRGIRPLMDGAPVMLCGKPAVDGSGAHLWTRDAHGFVTMEATATVGHLNSQS